MSTPSPTSSQYAVQLDSDSKRGIVPFADTGDNNENYEHMREFAVWVLTSQDSQASMDLRVQAGQFYSKLKEFRNSGSDLPEYSEYLDLVKSYNVEQGYSQSEMPEAPKPMTDNERIEAKLDELKSLITSSPASKRPGLMDKARKLLESRPAPAHSTTRTPPPASEPATDTPQTPPAGPPRRQH